MVRDLTTTREGKLITPARQKTNAALDRHDDAVDRMRNPQTRQSLTEHPNGDFEITTSTRDRG